jgi:hypothetical protein
MVLLELENLLLPLINQTILDVAIDTDDWVAGTKGTLFGEHIVINFSSGTQLSISTDDIPHIIGNGDLDFELTHKKISDNDDIPLITDRITDILIYNWKPQGIRFFSRRRYLVQVSFQNKQDTILTIGFFFRNEHNEVQGLITGELAVSFNALQLHEKFATNIEPHSLKSGPRL